MSHHIIPSDHKNRDKQIPYLLFDYRKIANNTTGISQLKFMYGKEARGPLAVLKST